MNGQLAGTDTQPVVRRKDEKLVETNGAGNEVFAPIRAFGQRGARKVDQFLLLDAATEIHARVATPPPRPARLISTEENRHEYR